VLDPPTSLAPFLQLEQPLYPRHYRKWCQTQLYLQLSKGVNLKTKVQKSSDYLKEGTVEGRGWEEGGEEGGERR